MKFLWRNDLGQGKHDPLEVTHVVTKSGSQISADLVVALDPGAAPGVVPASWHIDQKAEIDGLLEVIDAQLAAIDEQAKQIEMLKAEALTLVDPDDADDETKALKEWADQFPDMIEDLCMALGFARNPIAPTGIPELDIIVKLAR